MKLTIFDNMNVILLDRSMYGKNEPATIEAGKNCQIIAPDGYKIIAGENCDIDAGERCKIVAGENCLISAGNLSIIENIKNNTTIFHGNNMSILDDGNALVLNNMLSRY